MRETRSTSEFYVGYLPVPAGYRRALRMIVPTLFVVFAALAMVVSARQKDPGTGVWSDSITTLEGVVTSEPYAMLWSRATNEAGVETVLLVEEGKFGAKERIRPFDGQVVLVSGTILERDGRRILELASSKNAVRPADRKVGAGDSPPTERSQGTKSLRGEIIDPKCYFGAMKPGDGKTHKACATLCISGGIPPMFRTLSENGRPSYLLLMTRDSRAINVGVLPFVGDPVEITGEVVLRGDLMELRTRPADIRRIPGN